MKGFAVGSKNRCRIIWVYQKEGMFCSTCGKRLLHLMADRKGTRQRSCFPTHCRQGEFRCPQSKQLSKAHFCFPFSVSLTFLKYFWADESNRFFYLREGSISLMSLTSKQGFSQSTDSEMFESGIHSRIAEKGGHIAKSYMKAEFSL